MGGPANFGVYNQNCIDDLVYSFESPLHFENSASVIEQIFKSFRIKQENLTVQLVIFLLRLGQANAALFEFIFLMPSSNYLFAKLTDFCKAFIQGYQKD